jgi:hypothetical protein
MPSASSMPSVDARQRDMYADGEGKTLGTIYRSGQRAYIERFRQLTLGKRPRLA